MSDTPGKLKPASRRSIAGPLTPKRKAKGDGRDHDPQKRLRPTTQSVPTTADPEECRISRQHVSLGEPSELHGASSKPTDAATSNRANTTVDGLFQTPLADHHCQTDITQIEHSLSNLAQAIVTFVYDTFCSLKLEDRRESPGYLVPEPGPGLSMLYAHCWSRNWSDIEKELKSQKCFAADSALQALVSAIVFTAILQDASPWQSRLFNTVDLPGAKDIFYALTSDDETERINAMGRLPVLYSNALKLVSSVDCSTVAASFGVDLIAKEYCHTLDPDLDTLDQWARVGNAHTIEKSAWRRDFSLGLQSLLSQASGLRCDIMRSRYKHKFFWPTHRAPVDLAFMQPALHVDTAGRDSCRVAFTLFPGLKIDMGTADSWTVIRAADVYIFHEISRSSC